MIGIYKITSPTKKVYIGQSVNIENRKNDYIRLKCRRQPAVYNSLKKYGFDSHIFEILCECEISELNEKERYYQDLYSVLNKGGLNCFLVRTGNKIGCLSEETKRKIGNGNRGKTVSLETRKKLSYTLKNISSEKREKINLSHKNKSEETRQKIGEGNRGKIVSAEVRMKISESMKGLKKSSITCEKLSVLAKLRTISERTREGKRKKLLNIYTGIYYDSIKDAAYSICLQPRYLSARLRGYVKNKTGFIYI